MQLLRCLVCEGELEITSLDDGINKKVRCLSCGFTNDKKVGVEKKSFPEVIVLRKRSV